MRRGLLLLIALLVSGCSSPAPLNTPAAATPTAVRPVPTPTSGPSATPASILPTPQTASATGRIILGYGDRSPVADLPLWLGQQSQGQPATRTDADGRFILTGLPLGQVVDVADDHLAFQIHVTTSLTVDVGTLEYPLIHPGPQGPTPTPAPAAAPDSGPPDVHQTLSSGLSFDAYALQGAPTLDPLDFTPVRGTRADIVARHRKDGRVVEGAESFFTDQGPAMSVAWQGQTLIAQETFISPTQGIVNVLSGSRLIMTAPIGDGSPLDNLRRLLTWDDHWFLETAYVRVYPDPLDNSISTAVTGQIFEDGQLLNTRAGYQEAFGLQLLHGQPFYFFERGGVIGVAYNGQELWLGFDSIRHYGCCSYALLNPVPRENKVAFFGLKDGEWYYAELGVYDA